MRRWRLSGSPGEDWSRSTPARPHWKRSSSMPNRAGHQNRYRQARFRRQGGGSQMLAAPIGVLALVVGCAVNSVAAFEGERFAGAEPGRNAARRPAAGIPATEDLNAIVDGLQRKYSSIIGIAADFSQVYQGTDGRTVRESGRLL